MLAAFSYDDLGRRSGLARGNGVETAYGYDGVSRLTSLAHDPSGTAHDQSWEFDHNPAGQIVSQTAALSGWGWTMGSGEKRVKRPPATPTDYPPSARSGAARS